MIRITAFDIEGGENKEVISSPRSKKLFKQTRERR